MPLQAGRLLHHKRFAQYDKAWLVDLKLNRGGVKTGRRVTFPNQVTNVHLTQVQSRGFLLANVAHQTH